VTLEINELRQKATGGMYVSPERICVTADGVICDEQDPRAVRLLVGKGGSIPATEAARYGLIADAAPEAPEHPEPARARGKRAKGDEE